jgi:hypothetical protein
VEATRRTGHVCWQGAFQYISNFHMTHFTLVRCLLTFIASHHCPNGGRGCPDKHKLTLLSVYSAESILPVLLLQLPFIEVFV